MKTGGMDSEGALCGEENYRLISHLIFSMMVKNLYAGESSSMQG